MKELLHCYSVLDVHPSAEFEVIKSNYRRLAKKYHPDKVASLGEDVKKQAEEKFRQVQDAYESLKKERGF